MPFEPCPPVPFVCVTVKLLVPVSGLVTLAEPSKAAAKYVWAPAGYVEGCEHTNSLQLLARNPSTYMSTRFAFTLADAVIVTVSAVVGLCGLWDIVSEMLLFVVVFAVWFELWLGVPPPGAGMVNDLVPYSGSVSVPTVFTARAK